ncbi:MAG: ATP-binding protein [Nitrospirota bacterium]
MDWLTYHIGEEFLIAAASSGIALRAFSVMLSLDRKDRGQREQRSRVMLVGAGFLLLAVNSAVHAQIHMLGLNQNLLYQTLLGYCLGLLTLIAAISSEKPWRRVSVPLLYMPLLLLLMPQVYERFPIFGQFRPFVWMVIAYLSAVVCMLYVAAYYHTKLPRFLFSALGHLFICISSVALFFPSGIRSDAWVEGHLLRPVGFVILFFSMNRTELLNLKESILYKALAAFSLLASIPLLVFGTVVFYENFYPMQLLEKRLIVFLLVLVTLASALVFGLGMVLRLIRPILELKETVEHVAEEGLNRQINTQRGDEIGKLSHAFNDMMVKLKNSFAERERLSRLAATGQLAATLAHEIKNPLNAIGGAAQYIGKNFRGSLIREFVRVINDETMRINKLTSNLLNFSKPIKTEPAPGDLNLLVNDTVNLLKQEYEGQGIRIRTFLDATLPEFPFDHNQVKQVLLNLLLNSFDAVDGRGGEVTVSTATQNGTVVLSVKDNGKGIRPEDMEDIFNPFFTTKTRGTGLGLAISKKTAREHGGDMLVESEAGKGSVFTLVLPKSS